ncbi:MAG: carbohydrate ABC transporter substrate-binding protein [Bacilli bacterium]
MKKNVLTLLCCVGAVAGLASCGNQTSSYSADVSDGGKVINIRCWNNEFEGKFKSYYPNIAKDNGDDTFTLKNGNTVKFIIVANDGNAYQTALDKALAAQNTAAADDKVDMFLMEADYALKYANSDYSLDVKDLGLTNTDTSDMYDYTKVIATDTRSGRGSALKGVSWQATPGLYAYRTDIAEDVLGTSDPTEVQSKIDTWDKFDAVAAQMKAKEHYMLSGYDDSYRTFSNNASKAWADDSGKISIDPQIKKWVKQTKSYTDSAYSHKTKLWDTDWGKDQGPTGNVFGFFYSTWGINFTLKGNSLATAVKDGGKEEVGNGLFGKYRVCRGPANYYWGGTWLCGANGTDNKSDVADIMKSMTCDSTIAEKITRETEDYCNNKTAMHKIATDTSYGSAFLGGQNHIALFEKTAADIKMTAMSAYDQGCNEQYQNAMHDYFAGTPYATAIATFKTKVTALYPEATYDSSVDADIA